MFDYDKVRFPTYTGKVKHFKGITITANDVELFRALKQKYGYKKAFDLFAERHYPTVSREIIKKHFR